MKKKQNTFEFDEENSCNKMDSESLLLTQKNSSGLINNSYTNEKSIFR